MNPEENFENYIPERELLEYWGLEKRDLEYLRQQEPGIPFVRVHKNFRLYPRDAVGKWLEGLEVQNKVS